MRILGIDPGLRVTGYGMVETAEGRSRPRLVEGGVLRIPTDLPLPARLRRLHEDAREIVAELEPDLVAVESVFTHHDRAAPGVRMAHARGVLLLVAAQAGVDVMEFPPARIKKSLTGDGSATKERMQAAITERCGLPAPPEPNDVADALAIALCAADRLDDPVIDATGRRPSNRAGE